MPRPQLQEAAPEPAAEFEHLLQELSAQFERLRQQNLDLTCKCAELCEARTPDHACSVRPCLKGAAGVKEHNGLAAAGSTPLCPKGVVEIQEPPRWRPEMASEESAVSQQSAMQLASLQQPAADNSLQQSASPSSWRTTLEQKLDKMDTCSPVSLRSRVSLRPNTGAPGLEDQFRKLDSHKRGSLDFADLRRIISAAGEGIEYAGLINMLRLANQLEPLDIGDDSYDPDDWSEHRRDVQASMALMIDYQAFLELVEGRVFHDKQSPGTTRCIESFRKACSLRMIRSKSRQIYAPPPPMPEEPTTARTRARWWLETVPPGVILVNALVTGFSADDPANEGTWDMLEYVFAVFYLSEFVLKVSIFGWRDYFFGKDLLWNWFDFVCLMISVADTTVKVAVAVFYEGDSKPDLDALMLIKIFRLARLARLVRTLRFKLFHELKLMVLGVFSGLRVLTWAIVLLVVLIYIFGVAMTNLFGKNELEFSSVYASMFTLFRCWTEGCAAYDGTPLAERLRARYGPWFMAYHILMTTFVTVGVFNLVMAIFIDNVVTNQTSRKIKEMGEKTTDIELRFKALFIKFIKHGVQAVRHDPSLYCLAIREIEDFSREVTSSTIIHDEANKIQADWEQLRKMDFTITKDVFRAWLWDDDFLKLLDDAEIESANNRDLFDVLDADMGGELSMDELINGLLKLRGGVTKSDIVAVSLKVSNLTKLMENLS